MAITILIAVAALNRADNRVVVAGSGQCEITLTELFTINGDHATNGGLRIIGDRAFLIDFVNGQIQVFDLKGKHLQSWGGKGEGPGEFQSIQDVRGLPNGRVAVFDSNLARMTIFDPNGTVMSTTPLPARLRRNGAHVLPDGSIVLMGAMNRASLFGHPMVRINAEGQVLNYFGTNEVETVGPLAGQMYPRVLTYDVERGVIAVKWFTYTIEQYDIGGRLRRTWERKVDWLVWPSKPYGDDAHRQMPPEELVVDTQLDTAGRLWVIGNTGDPEWESASSEGPISVPQQWWDGVLEVFDLNSESVICTATYDHWLVSFAGSGMLHSYEEDEDGNPRVRVWRAVLKIS